MSGLWFIGSSLSYIMLVSVPSVMCGVTSSSRVVQKAFVMLVIFFITPLLVSNNCFCMNKRSAVLYRLPRIITCVTNTLDK